MFDNLKNHLEEKLRADGNLEDILQLAYFDAFQVNELDGVKYVNTAAHKKWKDLYVPLICNYVNGLKEKKSMYPEEDLEYEANCIS